MLPAASSTCKYNVSSHFEGEGVEGVAATDKNDQVKLKHRLLAVTWFAMLLHAPNAMPSSEPFAELSLTLPAGTLFKGAFSPNGKSFYFFREASDEGEDYRIFVIHETDGIWSSENLLEFGDDYSDLYPTISPEGHVLVFSSYRPIPGSSEPSPIANLWLSRRVDDDWSQPEFLEKYSTPENYDAGSTFAPDGQLHFQSTSPDWSETTHYRVNYVDGQLSGPGTAVDMTALANWRKQELYFWGATLSPKQDVWIAEYSPLDEDGRAGPSDLYHVRRFGEHWGEPQAVASDVNLPESTENFVVFGPTGEDLYFVRDFSSYYRVSLKDALRLD